MQAAECRLQNVAERLQNAGCTECRFIFQNADFRFSKSFHFNKVKSIYDQFVILIHELVIKKWQ
jgi:hypothetical protein